MAVKLRNRVGSRGLNRVGIASFFSVNISRAQVPSFVLEVVIVGVNVVRVLCVPHIDDAVKVLCW